MRCKPGTIPLIVTIPTTMLKRLEFLAARSGMSVQEFVLAGLQKQLSDLPIPTKETLKAIKDAKEGKGLIEIGGIEDLIKRYGR